MKRKERTEVLVHCSEKFLRKLSDEVQANYEVVVLDEPSLSLAMVKVREGAQNSLFYLCEVLVSECRVQIEGSIGIGIIKGIEEDKAYCLALIDAAFTAGLGITEGWIPLIKEEREKQKLNRIKINSSIMKTKVNFESMDV